MSASDHLHPQQFYHGSDAHIQGGQIEPGHGRRFEDVMEAGREAYNSGHFAYATTDPWLAYAHSGAGDITGSHWRASPTVYHVEPTGPVVRDPEDEEGISFMSEHPWRIVRPVARFKHDEGKLTPEDVQRRVNSGER